MILIVLLIIIGLYLFVYCHFYFLDNSVKSKFSINKPLSKGYFSYLKSELANKENIDLKKSFGTQEKKIFFKNKYQAFQSFKFDFVYLIIQNIIICILGLGALFLLYYIGYNFVFLSENFKWNSLNSIFVILIIFVFLLLSYFIIKFFIDIFQLKVFKNITYTEKGIFIPKYAMNGGHGAVRKIFFLFENLHKFNLRDSFIEIVFDNESLFNIKPYVKFRIYLEAQELQELNQVLQNKGK